MLTELYTIHKIIDRIITSQAYTPALTMRTKVKLTLLACTKGTENNINGLICAFCAVVITQTSKTFIHRT